MADDGDQSAKPEPKSIGEWIGDALGVRLPKLPQTLRNLDKAGGALLDIPAAWAASKAQRIRGQADRKEKLDDALTKALTQRLGKSSPEDITQRVDGMLIDYLEKHESRKRVLELTAEELQQDPPKEDAKVPLNDDWMAFFKGKVDALGTEDGKVLFAKVLAGEIKHPGSFSKRAISILAEMDQQTGKLFEALCNITMASLKSPGGGHSMVLTNNIGNPGQNALAPFGLNYDALSALTEAGLIVPALETEITVEWKGSGSRLGIGKKPYILTHAHELKVAKLIGVALTIAGRELLSIVSTQTNEAYITKLIEGLKLSHLILLRDD